MSKNPLLVFAICLVLAPAAIAQAPPPTKKLYCWNANGQRVCSDALPGDAVNHAREEISAKSGMRLAEVQRAMNDEERALAASNEQQRQVDQAAADTRRRTDQAMLASYQTEDELRRVFNERISIVDNSIRTARYNVTSLREGLVSLLQTAGDRELGGAAVTPQMADNITSRHRELVRQKALQSGFEKQRVDLDGEIAEIMQRYHDLKGGQAGDTTPTATSAATQASTDTAVADSKAR